MDGFVKFLLITALSLLGTQCGKNLDSHDVDAMNKFGGDTIMLTYSPDGATYVASQSEYYHVISSKSNVQKKGLSINFYAYRNEISVSYLSNDGGIVPFCLSIGSLNGSPRPSMYYYNDYVYPTDTVIDVKNDFRGWRSAIGKCFIVKYWPNSMCRSEGVFLYNENYEIDGGISIGIHRKYDECGNLTDVVDTDTLDLYERL